MTVIDPTVRRRGTVARKLRCSKCGCYLANPAERLYVGNATHVCLDAFACERRRNRVAA